MWLYEVISLPQIIPEQGGNLTYTPYQIEGIRSNE